VTLGHCKCETGLADAAGVGRGDETNLGTLQQRADLGDLALLTGEAGERQG
jgi:hypothetical protein